MITQIKKACSTFGTSAFKIPDPSQARGSFVMEVRHMSDVILRFTCLSTAICVVHKSETYLTFYWQAAHGPVCNMKQLSLLAGTDLQHAVL